MRFKTFYLVCLALSIAIVINRQGFAQQLGSLPGPDEALLIAIMQRKATKVKYLLEHKANPNGLDPTWSNYHTSALFLALGVRVVQNDTVAVFPVNPDPAIVSLLLQHRADRQIKKEDGSPLAEIAGWKQQQRWLLLYIHIYTNNTKVGIHLTREKRRKVKLIEAFKAVGIKRLD